LRCGGQKKATENDSDSVTKCEERTATVSDVGFQTVKEKAFN
jgi:hypothetical protein